MIGLRLLCLLALIACAAGARTDTSQTNAKNFRSRVEIEELDCAFFNGRYAGAQEDCFPPPGKRICTRRAGEVDRYVAEREIAAEEYRITINDWSGVTSTELKDLAQLAAAEVAVQQGYARFTTTWQLETSSCGAYYTADTYGTLSGTTYRGSTSVREHAVCANSLTLSVFAYSDQDAIDRGVLYRVGSGWARSDKLAPYHSLYKGTTPFDPRFDQPPTPSGNSIITYPSSSGRHATTTATAHTDAWKNAPRRESVERIASREVPH